MRIKNAAHSANDAAILEAALQFAVTVLPDGDDSTDYMNIRVLNGMPDPLTVLTEAPHLASAARLALHRFVIELGDEGHELEAEAADALGFRLRPTARISRVDDPGF